MCTLCNVRVKNERLYRAHRLSAQHCAKLPAAAAAPSGPRRVVVFGDPIAHHSTLLPFREAAKQRQTPRNPLHFRMKAGEAMHQGLVVPNECTEQSRKAYRRFRYSGTMV